MLGLAAGQVFAEDFQIIRPLGEGGMGSVYLALQRSTGRKRALKILQPHLVADPRIRERFALEARAASNLQTDHVVEVVSAGIDLASGMPWLAMEYLEGETLRSRVKNFGHLAPREVAEILRQLGHGLAVAHQSGLVHRDLKPANVFIADPRREGIPFTVKLLDFGIVQLGGAAQGPYGGPLHPGQSAPIGSPGWMAPEQFQAHAASPACDVWAFGLLAYYCLVGTSFWAATEVQALVDEVLHSAHPRASDRAWQRGVMLPQGFDEWFSHCTAKDPGRRYPSIQGALSALLPLLDAAQGSTSNTSSQSTPSTALGPTVPQPGAMLQTAGVPTAGGSMPGGASAAPSYVTLPATDSLNTFSPLADPPGNTLTPNPSKRGAPWLLLGGLGAGALALFGVLGAVVVFVWAPWEEPAGFPARSTASSAASTPTGVAETQEESEPPPEAPAPESPSAAMASTKPRATATTTATADPTGAPSADPTPSADAPGASEAPSGAPTPIAAAGFRALMVNCWRNNEGA
ncbi:MAG: serine/threonine protein kinase, partial [Myxococcales bacterium]|nr:serine/threonine protein kinase [Myxococcales bacterium]